MQKVVTFFWMKDRADEAVNLYVSLFDDAKITRTSYVTQAVAEAAGIEAGSVSSVDFVLSGQNFTALNGGPMYKLSEATSIVVSCKDQAEIDKLWDALSEGGQVMSCGWVTDRYGVTWQIMPETLDAMMSDPDPVKAERVSTAMLGMEGKLDLGELERAYRGE
jgi:predicted 3-demethylubiquinone-9 3-methyltransferase (glyoxalase superfamily)